LGVLTESNVPGARLRATAAASSLFDQNSHRNVPHESRELMTPSNRATQICGSTIFGTR
jgi:hypothetical protein